MTLNDITAAALTELGRGHDARSVDTYRRKFMHYANDALCDLAACFSLVRTEKHRVQGSTVDLMSLARPCMKVLSVTQDGFPVRFEYLAASNFICIRGTGNVDISYRYVPKRLALPSDVPEIPEHLHGLIVMYVVGRERMSGDASSQHGADAYLGLYETEKQRIRSCMYPADEIENKW